MFFKFYGVITHIYCYNGHQQWCCSINISLVLIFLLIVSRYRKVRFVLNINNVKKYGFEIKHAQTRLLFQDYDIRVQISSGVRFIVGSYWYVIRIGNTWTLQWKTIKIENEIIKKFILLKILRWKFIMHTNTPDKRSILDIFRINQFSAATGVL